MDEFAEKMDKILNDLGYFPRQTKINIARDEKIEHKYKTACYLCGDKFNMSVRNFVKVKDHCHGTGKYWGSAHLICNLRYKEKALL